MVEKFLLLFEQCGRWCCSNHSYNGPVGVTHGIRRLQKDNNRQGSTTPVTRFRAIHVVIDPDKGVETSGIFKEYPGDF